MAADKALVKPAVRNSADVAAPRGNELSADAQASRREAAPGTALRPSQVPVSGATTRRTGFSSPAGQRAHRGPKPLRPGRTPAGAAAIAARPSTVPARPVPDGRQSAGTGIEGLARDLQRKAGNRATAALLAAGQPLLAVSPAGDQHEREADSVAGQVIASLRAGPGAAGRALAAPEEDQGPEEDQETPVGRQVAVRQRAHDGPMGAAGGDLDARTEERVNRARRGGLSLPSGARGRMEGAFGADFAPVKVHTGPEAEALNHDVGALAFTVGSDIFLGRSAPALASPAGESLLAHELTHTIQQGGARLLGGQGVQRVFTDSKNRANHYQKHVVQQKEYPASMTEADYDKLSTTLWANKSTLQSKTAANGRIYVYDSAANDFGAFDPLTGGAITVFKPTTGQSYYDKQK